MKLNEFMIASSCLRVFVNQVYTLVPCIVPWAVLFYTGIILLFKTLFSHKKH